MTTAEKKTWLEKMISRVAGVPLEITVRGERSFTFSASGNVPDAILKAKSYFGKAVSAEVQYDAECDMTFMWIEVK